MDKDTILTTARSVLGELKEEFVNMNRAAMTITVILAVLLSFFPLWVIVPAAIASVAWLARDFVDELRSDAKKDVDGKDN